MIKIRLYLLGVKGFRVLESLIKKYGTEIIDSVIIGRDKNILDDYFTEIISICDRNSISHIERLEDNLNTKIFSIAVGWRWIIDLERVEKLIVLHDSILPKYRGFNPLVTCLINGDSEIGVTALFANEKFDRGDVIYQSKSKIKYPIKINDAIGISINNYIVVVTKIIEDLNKGKELPRFGQIDSDASYSLWRDEEDYQINWAWENYKIKRFIDAVGDPYLGAVSIVDNKKIRIVEVEELENIIIENRTPGKIIYFENDCPVVVCGFGLLKINKMTCEKKTFILNKLRVRFK